MSDSKQTDTDRAMARLLADALRRPPGARGDSACPDAEILAAYAEHNLDAAETAQWEKHFADCGSCQKILAILTVSAEPLSDAELEHFGRKVAAVELGAPAAATHKPKANVTPFERQRTAWRWLASALGVAAAAALWIALRPIQRPSSVLTAQKTANEPAAPPRAATGADTNAPATAGRSLEARANVPAPPVEAEKQAEQQQLSSSAVAGGLKKEALPPNRDRAQLDQVQKATAPQFREETPKPQSEPVLQAANEAQQNPAQAKPSESANASAASAVNQAEAAPPAAPAAPSAPSADAAGRVASPSPAPVPANSIDSAQTLTGNAQVEAQSQAKTAPNRTVQFFAARQALAGLAANAPGRIAGFTSPSTNVSWRVGSGGMIQHSTDRGPSWQPQASGVTSDLLGGTAPSDKIAWIVGRAGVILRTTDGEHWQRTTSPEPSTDWAAVQAADAQHATITSTDQRRFATEDGGQSWRPQ